jgi:hypothetical protein
VEPEQSLFGPEWYQAWNRTWTLRSGWVADFVYVAARDSSGVLQGVLPMAACRCGPVVVRAQTGYAQPCRPLLSAIGWEREVGAAIGDFVGSREWDLIGIGPLLEDRTADAAMIDVLRQKTSLYDYRSDVLAVLDLPATWELYCEEVLGRKFFRKIAYYERRTARAGDMRIVHTRKPSPDEAATLFEQLAAIESRSWLTKRGTPRFIGSNAQVLWNELTTRVLTPNDNLDCWTMFLDGRPVSFCLTLTAGTCRYVIANNYDERCRDHRTGSTLYRYMLEEAFERRVRRVDFGRGEMHYKGYWGAIEHGRSRTLLAFRKNIVGHGARLAFAVAQCIFGDRTFGTIPTRLL